MIISDDLFSTPITYHRLPDMTPEERVQTIYAAYDRWHKNNPASNPCRVYLGQEEMRALKVVNPYHFEPSPQPRFCGLSVYCVRDSSHIWVC